MGTMSPYAAPPLPFRPPQHTHSLAPPLANSSMQAPHTVQLACRMLQLLGTMLSPRGPNPPSHNTRADCLSKGALDPEMQAWHDSHTLGCACWHSHAWLCVMLCLPVLLLPYSKTSHPQCSSCSLSFTPQAPCILLAHQTTLGPSQRSFALPPHPSRSFCAHTLMGLRCVGHASGMVGVDISQDGRALLGVGLDAHAKQLMVLWDISQLRFGGKVSALQAEARTQARQLARMRMRTYAGAHKRAHTRGSHTNACIHDFT